MVWHLSAADVFKLQRSLVNRIVQGDDALGPFQGYLGASSTELGNLGGFAAITDRIEITGKN